jgi:hypothetical protein
VKLPHADKAGVPRTKVLDYLLARIHPHGRHKAAYFTGLGFTRDAWRELATILSRHAGEHEIYRVEDSRFGTRYVVEGPIEAPDGTRPRIRTVWFVEIDSDTPRLVTAYPVRRGTG